MPDELGRPPQVTIRDVLLATAVIAVALPFALASLELLAAVLVGSAAGVVCGAIVTERWWAAVSAGVIVGFLAGGLWWALPKVQ